MSGDAIPALCVRCDNPATFFGRDGSGFCGPDALDYIEELRGRDDEGCTRYADYLEEQIPKVYTDAETMACGVGGCVKPNAAGSTYCRGHSNQTKEGRA